MAQHIARRVKCPQAAQFLQAFLAESQQDDAGALGSLRQRDVHVGLDKTRGDSCGQVAQSTAQLDGFHPCDADHQHFHCLLAGACIGLQPPQQPIAQALSMLGKVRISCQSGQAGLNFAVYPCRISFDGVEQRGQRFQ